MSLRQVGERGDGAVRHRKAPAGERQVTGLSKKYLLREWRP